MINELRPEMLSVHALNALAKHNSSSRGVMYASHISQRLVIHGAQEKIVQAGIEQRFGKFTFSVKMPANGKIIKIIHRYPEGVGQDSLKFNPETLVIYENEETKEIDYFSIPYYASYHQFFGYKFSIKNTINMLKPGAYVPKDTIFADSPSVSENSGYMYGLNLNAAFMSIPSVSEDGIMICEDVLPRLRFNIYETRVVEFGASSFPLNLYGTNDKYKPFPEIGDLIRDDGILMMLRPYDNDLMPVEISVYDTMEPDFIFDKGTYVRGANGRIVDIKVTTSNSPNKQLPEGIATQADKYEKALLKFHGDILATEAQLRYERKRKYGEAKLKLSPKLHRLTVESLAVTNYNAAKLKQNLNLLYRKTPLDEYRVEFVVEYEVTPTIGFKLTDCHGGKGVICRIEKRENMPMDSEGNSADVVLGAESVGSRMNLGRLYEHYLSAAARDMTKRIRSMLGINVKAVSLDKVITMDPMVFNAAYSTLMEFYKLISEKQYIFYTAQVSDAERYEHIRDIVNEGIFIFLPIDNQKDTPEIVKDLEKHFRPTYGPVTYVGDSGNRCTTERNVRIAPLYMMLLDKIADDWSSVSSGKHQHFGVLSPPTKSEKFSYPFRNSPVRTIGETEGRIFAGYCGREAIAEMMDRSNSPMTQRNVVWNIMNADKPGNIEKVVDREYNKLGASRPLQLVRHIEICAGFVAKYEPEEQPR